jgi:16S rRNA (cytosine1402-N4)-methyltransferase
MSHEPVLVDAMLAALAPSAGELFVDATFGGGGYSRAILAAAPCRVIGLDRDPSAAARGHSLAAIEPRFTMLDGTFGALAQHLRSIGVAAVDGIVADLGVSSFQLDEPGRGFSFQADGPLDMRMGATGETAAELIARLDVPELTRLLFTLGEEPEAGRIARAIVARRAAGPITTTGDLAAIVAGAKRRFKPGRTPATQVFQALRIAVNDELGEIDRLLEAAPTLLRPGGRLVLVAFHSLEDRRIKRFIDAESDRRKLPSRHLPLPSATSTPKLRWLERKVIKPDAAEVARNPRARSARLRAAVRLADDDQTAAGHPAPDVGRSERWRAAA